MPAFNGWTEGNLEEPLSCYSSIPGSVPDHCDMRCWLINGHAYSKVGFIKSDPNQNGKETQRSK